MKNWMTQNFCERRYENYYFGGFGQKRDLLQTHLFKARTTCYFENRQGYFKQFKVKSQHTTQNLRQFTYFHFYWKKFSCLSKDRHQFLVLLNGAFLVLQNKFENRASIKTFENNELFSIKFIKATDGKCIFVMR